MRTEGKAPVEIRIGINTGEVVMRSVSKDQSHAEYLPAGHAMGLASRLQTLAPTGSIALSEPTRGLVEGYFQLKSLGPTRMKGVTEAVNVYEVIGLGPLRTRLQLSASRGLSRFVGRDAEISQMKRALEHAKSGHGQIRREDFRTRDRQVTPFLRVQGGRAVGMRGAGGVFDLARQSVRLSSHN